MSDADAEAAAPQGVIRWWAEGDWYPIPSEMLSPETTTLALAINDVEYPDLSALIRYADNVDGYLHMLGISESSILDQADPIPAENEEPMEMGE